MRPSFISALLLAAACTGCATTATAPAAAPAPAPKAAAPAAPPKPFVLPKYVPPSRNPASVASGTYMIEPSHTQVMFSVLHLGTSTYYGTFSGASGSLTIDAKDPAADQLEVSVPIVSVTTTSEKLTSELKGEQWLNADAFPTMTFKSTKVVLVGKTGAKVMGDLTLHGVTKPVTLTAQFVAAGENPLTHSVNIGFNVTGSIKRSDFGVGAFVPFVSDDTKIIIAAVFAR